MRFFKICVSVLFLLAAASAADFTIHVVDPQSAAVAGAQVELLPVDSSTPSAIATTSAEGVAVFRGTAAASYRVRVLAAGFAVESADISASNSETITASFRLAPAAETVT